MVKGKPKLVNTEVKVAEGQNPVQAINGTLNEVGLRAFVLSTSTDIDGNVKINSCGEIPSVDICEECFQRYNCPFSRAKEF